MNLSESTTYKTKRPYWIFFSVLVVLSLLMMAFHGSSASYSGYDFFFHYRRLDVLINALREGSYPIYFDYSNIEGYGYFFKAFYPDLTILPFALIGLFTGTYIAYDVMIFTITILCGVITYHAVNKIYKNNFAASVTTIFYTFATYRLYDIYQRGALGEAMSFTFIPLIFLGLYYVIKGDYRKWYVLAIGYSLLIYTHLIASVLMFITLIPFVIYYYKSFTKEPKRLWYLLLAAGVTLLISAFYVLPALEQMMSNTFYYESHTPGGRAGYNKYSFDLIGWGLISGLTYPAGKLFSGTGILLTIAVCLRFFVRGKSSMLRSVDFGVIIGVIYIFATSSLFPWGRLPFSLIGFIQYPWRLYEFSSLFFALAGGYYLSLILKNKGQMAVVFIIICIASIVVTINNSLNFKDLYNNESLQFYDNRSDEKPTIDNRYHLIGQEYLPTKVQSLEFIHSRGLSVTAKNETTQIVNLARNGKYTTFDVQVDERDMIELPLIYYLGYSATLNEKDISIEQSDNGLIQIPVDQSGMVEAYYKGTTVQWSSFGLTILAILALGGYIIFFRKKEEQQ